jgi:Tfp pilus assembly protein PilF
LKPLENSLSIPRERDRINRVVAAAVTVIVLVMYGITIAPTVSFWDSGEFIATAYILGIPHPPGTPLYVLVGRLFSMLPFSEAALGVNGFSALTGALAVLFLYLSLVRVVRIWRPERSAENNLVVYAGAAAGSLFAAFGATYWTNAIEAEVYAASGFLMSFGTWLMLKWGEAPGEPGRRNLVLVVAYLMALGVGLHLGTYLAAFSFLAFIVVVNWRLLLDSRFMGMVIALSVLGALVHLFIPIRSVLQPPIDESSPQTFVSFFDFVNRKQYKPMTLFHRQASWAFQFGHFWRYFLEQYMGEGSTATRVIARFLPLMGLLGLWVHLKKERRTFILLGSLFLLSGLWLIVYMNFTATEVRERDYFYTYAFFLYSGYMGIGGGEIISRLWRRLSSGGWNPRVPATGAAALLLLLPLGVAATHFDSHDRRGDFNAHDYAHNILVGLEPNSVIFTNGDNDTFPLWFLQEVKGFRKDVRVVNLSLLNTPWYILQLKHLEPKVPMRLSDDEIKRLLPVRLTDGQVVLVRDIAVRDILMAIGEEGWGRPVYFAVTVPSLEDMGLGENLVLEGLVFRVVPARTAEVDVAKTEQNLFERYRYRGLLDENWNLEEDIYRDSNTRSLMTNYSAAFIRLAYLHSQEGDLEKSIRECELAGLITPDYPPFHQLMAPIYVSAGMMDEAEEFTRSQLESNPGDVEAHRRLSYVLERKGAWEEAAVALERALEIAPDEPVLYNDLMVLYEKYGEKGKVLDVVNRWLVLHPDDEGSRELVERLEDELGVVPDAGGGSTQAEQ